MVRFADVEAAFLTKNPTATITKVSGGVAVNYGSGCHEYRYRGNMQEIAEKLHLDVEVVDTKSHQIDLGNGKTVINIAGHQLPATLNGGNIIFEFATVHSLKTYQDKKGNYFNFGDKVYF